jgi:hypothetical protein
MDWHQGKGVLVTDNKDHAIEHAEFYLQHGDVLVEEFLAGPEVSLFFLSDGTTVMPLTPAQDYKRAFDNNEGPNTGGMGAYSPLPWLDEGFIDTVQQQIAEPTIREMAQRGTPFVGLLYCGLVITDTGIKVIEFNVRFGDPETQVVLARLSSPLAPLLYAAATEVLQSVEAPVFSDDVALTIVLASEGIPGRPAIRPSAYWSRRRPREIPSASRTQQPPGMERNYSPQAVAWSAWWRWDPTFRRHAPWGTPPSERLGWKDPTSAATLPKESDDFPLRLETRLLGEGSRTIYSRFGI